MGGGCNKAQVATHVKGLSAISASRGRCLEGPAAVSVDVCRVSAARPVGARGGDITMSSSCDVRTGDTSADPASTFSVPFALATPTSGRKSWAGVPPAICQSRVIRDASDSSGTPRCPGPAEGETVACALRGFVFAGGTQVQGAFF